MMAQIHVHGKSTSKTKLFTSNYNIEVYTKNNIKICYGILN